MPYTNVIDGSNPVWQCNDCGAHADTVKNIVHFESCQEGESEKWEQFYDNENNFQEL